jgi:hypothetical protein
MKAGGGEGKIFCQQQTALPENKKVKAGKGRWEREGEKGKLRNGMQERVGRKGKAEKDREERIGRKRKVLNSRRRKGRKKMQVHVCYVWSCFPFFRIFRCKGNNRGLFAT